MIENFTSLRIKGAIFEEETKLPLFSKKKTNYPYPRFSLVYGKNGSGKSTISRGFRKIAGSEETQIEFAEMLDENDVELIITDDDQKSIYVFNEEFIEDNIRIDGDGLNTIIVMGEVKDVDDKIKEIQPAYNKSIESANAQQELLNQYDDKNNNLCPEYYINIMQKCLKGNNSWASRDAEINGKKINSSVRSDTYKRFIGLNPTKSRDDLIVEYESEMKKLVSAETGSKRIDTNVPKLKSFIDREIDIINLLKEKIEKPVLSEREKKLFCILHESNGNKRLSDIKSYFSSEQKTKCPYCFQDVDVKYADDLVKSIEKILNKKVEQHQEKLKKERLNIFEMNFSPFKDLSPDKVEVCEYKLEILNSTIEKVNELIDKKIENVYEPVFVDKFGLKKKYDECQDSLLELENLRKEYNSKATDTKPIILKLTNINNDIAYYDLKDINAKYEKQIKDRKSEDKKFRELENIKRDLQKQIEELEQQKKNAYIALNTINDDLAYIFFSEERLRIKYYKDKYLLYSHEKPVAPENVSVGERNAIGLCYFF